MRIEHLKVTGMSCGGCVDSVIKALKAVDGVGDVNVSLDDGEATVRYDEHLTSNALLTSAVVEAGYGVDEHARTSKAGCCG
jgi:copper chaperone